MAIAAAGLGMTASCADSSGGGTSAPREESSIMTDTSIVAAQEALTPSVMELPGVVGTAVGLCGDEPCIKVYVVDADAASLEAIPETYKGFTVDVEVTGAIRARGEPGR
jgi:hypothetical protein